MYKQGNFFPRPKKRCEACGNLAWLPQHSVARAGKEKKPIEVAGYFGFLPAPQHSELLSCQLHLPYQRF